MAIKGINICVYGLNRSLDVTIHSIEKKIFEPAEALVDKINYYAAFNITKSGEFWTQRSGEGLSRIGTDQQQLLSKFEIELVDQDDFDAQFNLADILSYGDCYQDSGSSILNMMRALNALQKCYNKIPSHARKSFPTIFIRPDLDIIDDIDIEFLLSQCFANSIVVPGWQFWRGVNDRFAIASAGLSAATYANRLNTVFQHLILTNRPFHSEQYLFDVLNLRKIRILPIVQTRFVRVRSGNALHAEATQHEQIQHASSAESWTLLTNQLMTMQRRLHDEGERLANLKETQKNLEQNVVDLDLLLVKYKKRIRRLRRRLKDRKNDI